MIKKPINDLSDLEKKLLLSYTLGGGSPTGGRHLSVYIKEFPDIHPNDLRNALLSLVSYGYLETKSGHGVDSSFFTEDGIFETNKCFKQEISKKVPAPTINPPSNSIPYPDKITMKWLWYNVPYSFWLWLISVLTAVFLAGVFVGQSKLYHDLTTNKDDSINLINKQTHAPTTRENNTDKTAAPVKKDTLRK